MLENNFIKVEITGVYDGVAFIIDKKTREVYWTEKVIEKTNSEWREEYVEDFIRINGGLFL